MVAMRFRIGVSRSLHLIDAENLCGASLITPEHVRRLRDDYRATVPVGPLDQIVIAASHANILAVPREWSAVRYLTRSGKDGADICLAKVVVEERLAERFDHVFFGSGDGGLAPFAAHLENNGVPVTAVSRISSLSPRMKRATTNVIYIDRPGIAVVRAA